MRLKTIEGITCPICGLELYDKRNLKEHFRYDHRELKLKVETDGTVSFKNKNSE